MLCNPGRPKMFICVCSKGKEVLIARVANDDDQLGLLKAGVFR